MHAIPVQQRMRLAGLRARGCAPPPLTRDAPAAAVARWLPPPTAVQRARCPYCAAACIACHAARGGGTRGDALEDSLRSSRTDAASGVPRPRRRRLAPAGAPATAAAAAAPASSSPPPEAVLASSPRSPPPPPPQLLVPKTRAALRVPPSGAAGYLAPLLPPGGAGEGGDAGDTTAAEIPSLQTSDPVIAVPSGADAELAAAARLPPGDLDGWLTARLGPSPSLAELGATLEGLSAAGAQLRRSRLHALAAAVQARLRDEGTQARTPARLNTCVRTPSPQLSPCDGR
jgi:hypothetical protein